MSMQNYKIGVVGLWHLGCVISASWSKLGLKVKGFDHDLERVKKLSKGILPIYEPGLQEIIIENAKNNLLEFKEDIKELSDSDFIFLTYDTPVLEDDSSDTFILEKSVSELREIMKDNSVLIISSQSPVGFCNRLREILKEKNRTLEISYSPENLRLGEAIN